MKITYNTFLSIILVTLFANCYGQTISLSDYLKNNRTPIITGDTVSQLGNNIMVIYQDSKNIYWFGSWESGIYRYDGKTMINYTTKHGLKNNRIDEIKEDKFGNIYFNSCYPPKAITRFEGGKFTHLTTNASNDWKLLPDDLWFRSSANNGHLYRFDGKTLHDLQIPKHPEFEAPYEIYSIYKDRKGNIWFGTNPLGVCRYNGKTFDWITEKDVTELDGGPANGVRSVIEDKDGYFWFNSVFRYNVFDSATAKGKPFYERQKSIGNLDGTNESNITEWLSIAKDNNENLWIATYRYGVWMYDGSKVKHYSVREKGKDIHLFYVYKDNYGDIWLGTHENGSWKLRGDTFIQFNL